MKPRKGTYGIKLPKGTSVRDPNPEARRMGEAAIRRVVSDDRMHHAPGDGNAGAARSKGSNVREHDGPT